jgi:ABC-type transport system substrate-binding protein
MEMEKKNVAIIVLAVVLVASGVGNVILGMGLIEVVPPTPPTTLLVGVGGGPAVIDPIDSWDSDSNDVITQVAEALWWYDLTNDSLPLVPLLAESSVWESDTELTVNIKHGVYFHDNTILDADAVKWNFDRILYFINSTGTLLPPTIPAFPASIYFVNGTSIINRTEVVDSDTVKIFLNMPFASFIPLMSYTGSSIISPTAHSATEYIDLTTEKLVGTGPFVYDSYTTDVEVRFHRWDRYWGDAPFFEKLVFVVIIEGATRNQAMLGHTIDILFGADPDLLDIFDADPETVVVETGTNMGYYYLAWDAFRINATWREAMAKAVNYDYIIDEIRQGNAVRGPPAVPTGMPGHDPTVVVPQYNVTEARLVMQSMGFGVGLDVGKHNATGFYPGTQESSWTGATFFENDFGHQMDLNYHQGSTFNRDLNDLIFHDLGLIGIVPVETTRNWATYLDAGEHGMLRGMWYIGWIPDYIDAFNMLDPLFNPASASNFINLTDSLIVTWLEDAATETDLGVRYDIFSDIQHRIFEVIYAHSPLMATLGRAVHGIDIQGRAFNALGNFIAWPIYRGLS